MRTLLVACLAGTLSAAPVPKELRGPDDLARLTGTWMVEECVSDGQDIPIEFTALRTIVFDGKGGMRETRQGVAAAEFSVTLDPDASPKRMVWREKKLNGFKLDCAYAFTADGLTICSGRLNKPPPTSLEPGLGVTVRTYKRVETK